MGDDSDYAFFTIGKSYRESSEGILARATVEELSGAKMNVFQNLDPANFNLYMNWLVRKNLPTDGHPDEDQKLVKLYTLGEALEDAKVREAIISSLMAKSNADGWYVPSVDTIMLAFGQSSSDSALRRLLVEILVRKGTDKRIETLLEAAPADFAKALAKELLKRKAVNSSQKFTTTDLADFRDSPDSTNRPTKRQKRN